jgi:CheY-like chemotaxis protein
MTDKIKILWADDEKDFLKSHIVYLTEKGYDVKSVSNGLDALDKMEEEPFDVIFLDESMPGLTGLETLQKIKLLRPNIPVVLITKNEEEDLMEDAIGSQIADYLIKPVKPQQILLTLKKLTDNKRLVTEKTNSAYQQEFQRLFQEIHSVSNYKEWVELYKKLIYWEIELDSSNSKEMHELLTMQKKEANTEFNKFVIKNYLQWVKNPNDEETPTVSSTLFKNKVHQYIKEEKPTVFILIDNLRYDQWKMIQPYLDELFDIAQDDTFLSILPTATQYSRNAIFAGMTPLEISKKMPEYWLNDDDEGGKNMYEAELLKNQIKTHFKEDLKVHYSKILTQEEGVQIEQNVQDLMHNKFIAIVYNFVDMISHARTEMEVIKELARDEKAFRSLTVTWFENSHLHNILKKLATKDINLIITTDHGTTQVTKPSKCVGDRLTSTNIRYKAGKNLQYNEKEVFVVKNPADAMLPQSNISTSYIFAKEENYLIYQNNYNQFVNFFKDSFQHGGISMEEMIVPFVVYESKKR